jgi:putative ABC transport system permease protein
MRVADHWRQVALSLSRHRLRTSLTAFGVFWGIFMVVLLLGIGKGLERGVFELFRDDAFNSIWIGGGKTSMPFQGLPPGRTIRQTIDDLRAIEEAFPGIADLTPRRQLEGDRVVAFGDRSGVFPIMSIYPGYHVVERTVLIDGRLINWRDVDEARRVAVIGSRVVELLFGQAHDPIGARIQIQGVSFLVAGTFTDVGDEEELRRIYIPYTAYQRSFGHDRRTDFIVFTTTDAANSVELTERLRGVLAARHRVDPADRAAFGIFNTLEEYRKFQSLFFGIALFIAVVGAGALFAGLVGVGNIMLIAVRERTREIGLRKAVGATPGAILIMILSEALMITTVAGYFGLVAGVGVVELLRRTGLRVEYFRDPEVDLVVAFGSLCILIVGGVVAGLIPARQAARVNPVEALRNE